MAENSRLKRIVDELNFGIQNDKPNIIHYQVFLLVNENYITEIEADGLLEDIYNNGCTYNYQSFLNNTTEDK